MRDIDSIRADLEKFTEDIEREQYENFSGQKDDFDTSSIYARYDNIFQDAGLLEEIRSKKYSVSGSERSRLSYLYSFLVTNYIDRKTSVLTDNILTLEAKTEVEVDGRKMPFRYCSVALTNEADHDKREMIDKSREPVFDQLNPLMTERLNRIYDITEGLGYSNYVELCEDITGIDLYDLRLKMQNILYRTDRLYTRYFRMACKNILDLNLPDVRKHDIAFLFRAKGFDPIFKKDNMMKVVDNTLSGIGLSLNNNLNIKLDTEEREKKSPRAFCSPIKVPDTVMLCIMPKGGMDDYRAFFHEMGHSQHFGNVNPSMPFEFKYLGDNSVTESYAFLFEHLVSNKNWIGQNFEVTDEELYRIVQFTSFHTLYMLRRYAAKLLYEIELHSGADNPEKIYSQLLGDALKFKHPENQYLYDCDPGFYCANYLRAWMFEVQLRNALVDDFGTVWWNIKDCGEYLKDIWSIGQKFNCDQMAKNLGYYGIDEYPLIRELEKNLRY
ncbi:hypothetical protein CUJ83_10700 [Methanocella sp. CWC-04]|uniref:Oligoendopeptidase F n=1 Tax=Methanooceanicella nereidis TaxID=2052831 RepID=A0AAP2W6L5_9EURY|nr:hypothetical protein [Methanocella sp. CWC-04]MCD1295468.1 hypothetical protein [Methanocella sp. CWC-04]